MNPSVLFASIFPHRNTLADAFLHAQSLFPHRDVAI